jgi:hypothetical protein
MSGQILTKEIATQWAMNWDPECPSDVLYPDIDACTSISDEAAAVFAEFEFKYGGRSFSKSAQLFLQITELSDTAAALLAKCQGKLIFGTINGGLQKLSDEAATHLATMKKRRLEFDGTDLLPDSAAKILRDAGHKC